MMTQMVINKRRDEIVAVVVSRLTPEGECLSSLAAGVLESMRVQLIFHELVGKPLIDQDRRA